MLFLQTLLYLTTHLILMKFDVYYILTPLTNIPLKVASNFFKNTWIVQPKQT